MKKFLFLLMGLSLVMTSCSTEGAEKAADEFHNKLNAGEIDYIMENLVNFGDSSDEDKATFKMALEGAHSWGKHENRKKNTGFNKSVKNGETYVKLGYTFDVEGQTMHERLVMIKQEDGSYKVLAFVMHQDEQQVIDYVSDY